MPRTGYEISKVINHVLRGLVTTDQRKIYYTLNKLESEDLATVEVVQQESYPDKKVFHITETGVDELKRWITSVQPEQVRQDTWMLQLFFADIVDMRAMRPLLEARRDYLQQQYEELKGHHADFERLFNRPDLRHYIKKHTTRLKVVALAFHLNRIHRVWTEEMLNTIDDIEQVANDDPAIGYRLLKSMREEFLG
jgi:DNA-binding PadR family transcriptional regulator